MTLISFVHFQGGTPAAYRSLTPLQQLIRTVSELKAAGVRFKGTLADAEFGTKDVIRAFVTNDDPLLTRMKSNSRVVLDGQSMTLATLARTYPRSTCHLYSKIGRRVKRVAVEYDGHAVTILIVWRTVNGCWKPFFLLTSGARGSGGSKKDGQVMGSNLPTHMGAD